MSKLHVYDFDGTLFRSPADTPENRTRFEQATGIPWLIDKALSRELTQKHGRHVGMRRGWWGRPETLEPPLVPDPAPADWFVADVCSALAASKADPDVTTIIMTGRFTGLRNHVLRILGQGGVMDVDAVKGKYGEWHCTSRDAHCNLYCLGDDYRPGRNKGKPADTFPWKVWLLEQYLDLYPATTSIDIWEDRAEHVEKFRELHGALVETVTVRHVAA